MGVQSLSYHHRGIWFELLMLMHCSEQRGRLVLAGKPMPNLNLARLLGLSEQETSNAVEILVASGVANRDQNGTLFNRRMVREEELRQKRREIGSKGGSKTSANREQTPDNDNGIENSGLERVREFARGKGIGKEDADWFYWKGTGNGWTNGGKPILDWKATLLSWHRAGYLPSQKQQRNGNGSRPHSMTYNQKERKINQLNERKAQLMRYPVDDTGNPVDRNISRELHQIDLELSKL